MTTSSKSDRPGERGLAHSDQVVKVYDRLLGASPVRSRHIEVRSGRRVHVIEAGEGPPVLHLHGSSTSSLSHLPLLERAEGVRSIAVDRPGFGLSEPVHVPGERFRDAAIEFVDEVLDEFGFEMSALAGGSTEGFLDGEVSVGDRFRVGSAELIVTEPRLPCFKLGIRMGRDEFVTEFLERGLLGFYLAVVHEGEVEAGDAIVELSRDPHDFKVTEITRLYARDREDVEGLQRAVELDVLPESWRNYFRKRLSDLERKRSARLLPAPAPPAWPDFRSFEVVEKRRETEDVYSFYLRPSDGEPLPAYKPGQFLTLRVPTPDGKTGAIRSYSLSDRPKQDAYRVTVKRIAQAAGSPDGGLVSSFLHDRVEVGDVLEVKAPAGNFAIDPEENYRPVVLIGAGIGITPILAMLNGIVEHGRERETWVFYGVRDHRDHLQQQHLEELAARHPFIQLHVCYSRPVEENGRALGTFHHAGRVTVELLKELLPASYYDYYLCGPGEMMQSLAEGLRTWGVPDDRIHSEAFGPAAIKAAAELDNRRDCGAQVTFARSQVTTVWSRCDSPLLELAEDNGISIPFGCRAGSCGTCVTKLLAGEVSYLHEPGAPLAEEEILTCVALPETELVLDV